MPISISQVGVLSLLWLFGLLEDIWFDRILRYQLIGQAERLKVSANGALKIFDARRKRLYWPILSSGLCAGILSFTPGLENVTSWITLGGGIVLCVWYIVVKLRPYRAASILLRE